MIIKSHGRIHEQVYPINYIIHRRRTYYRIADMVSFVSIFSGKRGLGFIWQEIKDYATKWRDAPGFDYPKIRIKEGDRCLSGEEPQYGYYVNREGAVFLMTRFAALLGVPESDFGYPFAIGVDGGSAKSAKAGKRIARYRAGATKHVFRGGSYTITEIAHMLGVSHDIVRLRLNQGMSADDMDHNIKTYGQTVTPPKKRGSRAKAVPVPAPTPVSAAPTSVPVTASTPSAAPSALASFERMRAAIERRISSLQLMEKTKKKLAEITSAIAEVQQDFNDAQATFLDAERDYDLSRSSLEMSVRGAAESVMASSAA